MPIVLLETLLPSPEEQRTIRIEKPDEIITSRDPSRILETLKQVETAVSGGGIAVGFVSYEAGFGLLPNMPAPSSVSMPLVWFAIAREHSTDLPSWISESGDAQVKDLRMDTSLEEYRESIHRVRSEIEQGNTYQVNYTLRYNGTLVGDPRALYKQLRLKQRVAYAAYLETDEWAILSLSPELFFRTQKNKITMRPMKGTAPRGRTLEEDQWFAKELATSEKERAENLMIVDLLRNDLGKICLPGTIQVTRPLAVERYDTVLQMTSEIDGILRDDVSLHELFHALFPSGSVTGAPKIRTMQIIHQLEKSPRQVYTGAIGFVSQKESAFSVAIRTAVVRNGSLEMGIGSGILYEADPEREYQECILKGRFLTDPAIDFDLLETILWIPNLGYQRLPLHMDRLISSAEYFSVAINRETVMECLEQNEPSIQTSAKVRLLVNRAGSMRLEASPVTDLSSSTIRWAESTVLSGNRFLFHKTTNREQYGRELKDAQAQGFVEALFRNERGEVTEGAISNIWILKDGIYYTPPVLCGLIAGTYRRHLLEDPNFPAEERVLHERDLLEADAIFISNAIRGLMRVSLVSA